MHLGGIQSRPWHVFDWRSSHALFLRAPYLSRERGRVPSSLVPFRPILPICGLLCLHIKTGGHSRTVFRLWQQCHGINRYYCPFLIRQSLAPLTPGGSKCGVSWGLQSAQDLQDSQVDADELMKRSPAQLYCRSNSVLFPSFSRA